jgi:hypothetical protein
MSQAVINSLILLQLEDIKRISVGVVSSFRREVDENCGLLGIYAASFGFLSIEDGTR